MCEKNIKKFFVRYMELKGYAMLHIFFFRMGNYFLFYQSPCCFYDLRDHSIVSLMIWQTLSLLISGIYV